MNGDITYPAWLKEQTLGKLFWLINSLGGALHTFAGITLKLIALNMAPDLMLRNREFLLSVIEQAITEADGIVTHVVCLRDILAELHSRVAAQ